MTDLENFSFVGASLDNVKWNPASEAVRYLGIHLNCPLTGNLHINIKLTETYAMLYPILYRKLKLKSGTAILIFKKIRKPPLMYGCELWGVASFTKSKKLPYF